MGRSIQARGVYKRDRLSKPCPSRWLCVEKMPWSFFWCGENIIMKMGFNYSQSRMYG